MDYEEVFAPLAKVNAIRVLLSLLANYSWESHQLVIKNAFLNGELQGEVFKESILVYKRNLGPTEGDQKVGI